MGYNIIIAIAVAGAILTILPWVDDLHKWYISRRTKRAIKEIDIMLERLRRDDDNFHKEFSEFISKESDAVNKIVKEEIKKYEDTKRGRINDFHDVLNSTYFEVKPKTDIPKIAVPKRKSDTFEDQLNNLKEDIMNHIRLFETSTGKEVADVYMEKNEAKLVDGTIWSIKKDIHISYIDNPKYRYDQFI